MAAPILHLVKLAVGVRDLAHLRAIQAERAAVAPLRHRTRNRPRRAAEIVGGGSIFWVIGGALRARQRIGGIVEDRWEDGSKCAGLLLDPHLVAVRGRLMRPFQGWRYLAPSEAPEDLDASAAIEAALPEDLRRELMELCLL